MLSSSRLPGMTFVKGQTTAHHVAVTITVMTAIG